MIIHNGVHGHTYYFRDNKLYACPTLADGGYQKDAEIAVDDFDEPLTDDERDEVIKELITMDIEQYIEEKVSMDTMQSTQDGEIDPLQENALLEGINSIVDTLMQVRKQNMPS